MTRLSLPLATVAIAAIAVVAAACGSSLAVSPSQPPASDPPVASPSQPPASDAPVAPPSQPPASEAPTPSPSQPPASDPPVTSPSQPPATDAPLADLIVDLNTVGGGPVRAIVRDETESLAGASSGDPADGVSVDFDDVRVEAIDDDSLRLTWADYPAPNEYAVLVTIDEGGRFAIAITRPEPTEPTDAIALDRVLVLDFHVAVPLSDVDASIR